MTDGMRKTRGKSSDGRDIKGFLNVEFKDAEHVKDAASMYRRKRVYVGLFIDMGDC